MIIMKLNGAILRDARDRKGKTLAQVSEETKMSIATLSKAENGGDIHASTGIRICEFLEIDLAKAVVPRHRNGNGSTGHVDA